MTSILVTGFGPWGSVEENPSALVIEALAASPPPGVVTLTLPVDSCGLADRVGAALHRHRPTLWIGLGVAIGAAVIAVERIAVNLLDFAEPDIAGHRPLAKAIIPGGPAAYAARLPVDPLVAGLRGAGIPARASTTAGTFLCNQLMYLMLHGIEARGWSTRGTFIHLPAHPALVARQSGKAAERPSMALDTMAAAVRLAIATRVA